MRYFIIILLFFWPYTIQVSKAEGYIDKQYNKYNLFIGVGYHNEKFDCYNSANGACFYGDSLGIVEFTFKPSKYTAIKSMHISNYAVKDHGLNAIFIGLDLNWK